MLAGTSLESLTFVFLSCFRCWTCCLAMMGYFDEEVSVEHTSDPLFYSKPIFTLIGAGAVSMRLVNCTSFDVLSLENDQIAQITDTVEKHRTLPNTCYSLTLWFLMTCVTFTYVYISGCNSVTPNNRQCLLLLLCC